MKSYIAWFNSIVLPIVIVFLIFLMNKYTRYRNSFPLISAEVEKRTQNGEVFYVLCIAFYSRGRQTDFTQVSLSNALISSDMKASEKPLSNVKLKANHYAASQTLAFQVPGILSEQPLLNLYLRLKDFKENQPCQVLLNAKNAWGIKIKCLAHLKDAS